MWGKNKNCNIAYNVTYIYRDIRKEREKGTEAVFEAIMMENFPKLIPNRQTRHQTTDARSSRTPGRKNAKIKQNEATTTKLYLSISYLQNIKDKEIILRGTAN